MQACNPFSYPPGIISKENSVKFYLATKWAFMDRMIMGLSRTRVVAGWILEFVLRQPIDDWIVNRLVAVLPLPNDDVRLKKCILLRRIFSEVSKGTISEKILDSLEMIEELDIISPVISSEVAASVMRTAYGYVVVANILRFLGDNPDDEKAEYYSAMQRIWTERISKMELAGFMGFIPRCWKEVKMELEAVVVAVAGGERVRVYELRKEAVRVALESLQEFLVLAAHDLGLPFLGVVSGYVQGKRHEPVGVWENVISCLDALDAMEAASTFDTYADQRACAKMLKVKKAPPHRLVSIG